MRSTWRIACVRIPRFPIGAVWLHAIAEGNGSLPVRGSELALQQELFRELPPAPSSPANGDARSLSLGETGSSSAAGAVGNGHLPFPVSCPPSADWDALPLTLTDGPRLRAVTAAAARSGIRAGMTAAEARARCATLIVLPWDDVVVGAAVRRATAAFLAASPQVTPVAGAPGLWWIGAAGLDSLGGEHALAGALHRLAARWHPGARVAIADSCVAARAATWEFRAEGRGPRSPIADPSAFVIVPPGGDAAYLRDAPLGLVPMDDELREMLAALGIRTAGAFAALSADDIERRWGADGLASWRLACGDDPRRPGLVRADLARSVTAELSPSVTTTEPILFLVRAALDRLLRELIADGRAAATLSITLTLDDARGALPTARAHTITREVRPARPLARLLPLLERCRALLDRWPLSAPVCAVIVAVTATAPLSGEQGDLLEPTWRDPAAAEAALARLRAELGPKSIVVPVLRDEHRPEKAGDWVEDDQAQDLGLEARRAEGQIADFASALGPRPSALLSAFRHLEPPEGVEVECEDGAPRIVWWRGRRIRVQRSVGPERLAGDWWKDGYSRDYWRCEEAEEAGELVLYHEGSANGGWYVQGWYD